ncbi:MAG TPA: hypothetical protein VF519_10990 [Mycobacteriales bacterium]|jgi:hypothetical protein
MRRTLAALTIAAAAATVVPATQAEAVYCGLLQPVCSVVCRVGELAGAYCLD